MGHFYQKISLDNVVFFRKKCSKIYFVGKVWVILNIFWKIDFIFFLNRTIISRSEKKCSFQKNKLNFGKKSFDFCQCVYNTSNYFVTNYIHVYTGYNHKSDRFRRYVPTFTHTHVEHFILIMTFEKG